MFKRLFILVIMVIFPCLSFSSSYDSYEMVAMDKNSLKKVEEVISSLNLINGRIALADSLSLKTVFSMMASKECLGHAFL